MRHLIAMAVTLTVLTGCVSKELRVKSNDYGIAHELIVTEYGDFNVYEHRSGKKFLVSSTIADAASQGAVKGLTFGGADTSQSEGAAQQAAEKYMTRHARAFGDCRIRNGYLVQSPVYEFILDCPNSAVTPKSLAGIAGGGSDRVNEPSIDNTRSSGGITCDGVYSPYANRDRDGDGIECEWDEDTRSAAPARSSSPNCFTGPRGGTYTITSSGKKNYGGC